MANTVKTWKEFKEAVEEALKKAELTEDIQLKYIDWGSGWFEGEAPEIVGSAEYGYSIV